MKPVIDNEKCIGCGTCEAIAPNVFEMGMEGDKNVAKVKDADYQTEKEKIDEAISACAVDAISWQE